MVARREQEARAAEFGRRADQCEQVLVCLRNAVSKKGDSGRVARDAPEMLDDGGGLLSDRIAQFARAIEAMNLVAEPVARGHVCFHRGTDVVAHEFLPERLALQDRHRFTGAETELGIETERAVVEAGLQQPNSGRLLPAGAIQHVLHQASADAVAVPPDRQ